MRGNVLFVEDEEALQKVGPRGGNESADKTVGDEHEGHDDDERVHRHGASGGLIGIGLGFLVALALRTYSPFPASVQTSVAILGIVMSSAVGLFFGIYPALRAANLDPIVALRSD